MSATEDHPSTLRIRENDKSSQELRAYYSRISTIAVPDEGSLYDDSGSDHYCHYLRRAGTGKAFEIEARNLAEDGPQGSCS